VLIISSVALAAFSACYAVIPSYRVMLVLVIIHGVFWSGLLSASASYMTSLLPESRRAEGIGYWGLSTVAAMAIAPSAGLWIYKRGWVWLCIVSVALNLTMTVIAWNLRGRGKIPTLRLEVRAERPPKLLEWRVLIISVSLFLYSFGYGGITSFTALYADANGVTPKSIYLTALAIVILCTRPMAGRLGDRWGYKRVFLPCLVLIALGMGLLAIGGTRGWMIASAIFFGLGFGTAYPVYVGYVMQGIDADRRGAAFGAILAAFDTGIGTGSTIMGWLIQKYGFAAAFGTAAGVAALALPYFLCVERLLNKRAAAVAETHSVVSSA
jgi:MFS family permease